MAFWAAAIPLATSLLDNASRKAPAPEQVSTPVDRRMQQMDSDPTGTLKQGRAQLSTMDESTQKTLGPVLDEAIKRAAQQRAANTGY